jgi:hypothetical protein
VCGARRKCSEIHSGALPTFPLPGNAPAGLLVNLMAAPRHEVLGYCGEVCRGFFTALR